MALKDLVADHRKIAEEAIEKIVAAYVRYDPAALRIVWTPQGNSLGNEARLLVYLVAVLGWQYVVDNPPTIATKPADLEVALGIPGGTMRPLLKRLKDSHLLVAVDGQYRAQLANLDSIEASIAGESRSVPRRRTKASTTEPKHEIAADEGSDEGADRSKKGKRSSSGQLKTFLGRWIKEGFFDAPKTISELLERFHEHGVITKVTSLSGLLLDAVRDGELSRTRATVKGKDVWTYTVPKVQGS